MTNFNEETPIQRFVKQDGTGLPGIEMIIDSDVVTEEAYGKDDFESIVDFLSQKVIQKAKKGYTSLNKSKILNLNLDKFYGSFTDDKQFYFYNKLFTEFSFRGH